MTKPEEQFEELAELARATDSLEPSAGFTDAVMRAVEQAEQEAALEQLEQRAPANTNALESVARQGRAAVVLAAIAAAACLWLSLQAEQRLDEEVLATVDVVEVAE